VGQLICDVSEDSSATRGDPSSDDQNEEPREKLVNRRATFRLRQEFSGEIFKVARGRKQGEAGGSRETKVKRAEAGLRRPGGKAASLAIGIAMVAAGRIVLLRGESGAAGLGQRDKGDWIGGGDLGFWFHGFLLSFFFVCGFWGLSVGTPRQFVCISKEKT